MKLILVGVAFVVGFFLALHLAMNAAVGKIITNARMGNAVFWLIGAVTALVIGVSNWDSNFFTKAQKVPAWLWFAGAMGACLVFAIAVLIPNLGAATTNVILLSGQVIGGLIIAHYGLLSSPVERITPVRIVGIALMIFGAMVVLSGKISFLQK